MASAANSSIALGIDIGSDKCVVAFVDKKGVVDVLQNEASKRETPVVVHFDKRQRLFGSAGAARANMDPKSAISQMKRLIGRRFDDKSFQKERSLLPYDTSEGLNGDIMVNVQYRNENCQFTAVQMLGMFLRYLKRMAEKATESTISDCVIGIPSYFTDRQRRDYLLAVEVAELNPLRLFHDGAATALDYGIHRSLPHGEATNVVFVDIGHGDTQVTVVKFCFGTATVLAHSFNRDLGGRDFDEVIFESFAEKFEKQFKMSVRQNPKATLRLRMACEKAKKVLSSNTEAQINIDCLMGDNDLIGVITRKEFEDLSSDLLDKIVTVCENALKDAGLIETEIHFVELVGSGSRIPIIQNVLRDFFVQEMSRTLNASECIANGCALQCEMLRSSVPNTNIFGVHDIFPFSVVGFTTCKNLSVTSTDRIGKGQLFLTTKVLTLHASKTVIISYADCIELPCDASENICQLQFDSIDAGGNYNLEVRIQFNINGMIVVLSTSLLSIDEGQHEPTSSSNVDAMECDYSSSSADNGGVTQNIASSPVTSIKSHHSSESAAGRRIPFAGRHTILSSLVASSSNRPEILKTAYDVEKKLTEHDSATELAKISRNSLEMYIYKLRDELSGGLGRYAGQSIKDGIIFKLKDTEEWIYGSEADESESAYNQKMLELRLDVENLLAAENVVLTCERERKENFLKDVTNRLNKISTRFGRFLNRMDKKRLSSMRRELEVFVQSHGILADEDYTRKHEDLESLLDLIKNTYEASEAKNEQKGILQNLFSEWWNSTSEAHTSVGNEYGECEDKMRTNRCDESGSGVYHHRVSKQLVEQSLKDATSYPDRGSGNDPQGRRELPLYQSQRQGGSIKHDMPSGQLPDSTTVSADYKKQVSMIKKNSYIHIKGETYKVTDVSNLAGKQENPSFVGSHIFSGKKYTFSFNLDYDMATVHDYKIFTSPKDGMVTLMSQSWEKRVLKLELSQSQLRAINQVLEKGKAFMMTGVVARGKEKFHLTEQFRC